MSKTCSECTYLDLCKEDYGKYWCDNWWKHEPHYADDEACSEWCEAYSRSSSEAKKAREHSIESRQSGCYITTMVCGILGLPDDNPYLSILRKFRSEVLTKDEKYRPLLVEYDVVGPEIARSIASDKHKEQISENFMRMGISKVVDLILEGKNDGAVSLYTDMTQILIDGYGIKRKPTTEEVKQADLVRSGHGVYIKK